ncbi:DUF58 domain-containing protein [Planctomycetota bacterium]|nr:DUF58 domain-containing protein [Planctomycetota bacterium]
MDTLAYRLLDRAPNLGHYWFTRLTPCGRVVLPVLVIAGSVAAAMGVGVPLYTFGLTLLAFYAVDIVVGTIARPKLTIERTAPERCAAGATVSVVCRIRNTGRLPALDLGVTELKAPAGLRVATSAYREVLDPGETAEFSYDMRPEKRGVYDLRGPVALSAFPFGIRHAERRHEAPHRLLVYPRFSPLGALELPVGAKHQPGGLAMVSRVGESEEFLGNRDYRPGDRLRDLDQAAWARVGYPVVREYQQEYLCRIALIVDSFVPKAKGSTDEALEAGISLGAAVADALSRLEYVIDIFAVGPDLYHLQAGRSLAYLDSILDILACIEPCRTSPFGTLGPAIQDEISRLSTAVVVLLDWDEERRTFVQAISDCGVATKVIVVRDQPTTLDLAGFATAAGPVQVLTSEEALTGTERL